jgi:hypothetical protein
MRRSVLAPNVRDDADGERPTQAPADVAPELQGASELQGAGGSRVNGGKSRAADGADESADEDRAKRADDHLADVPDGAGCTEIWEHLADRREDESDG